jgi:hypothetical protein
MVVSRDGYRAAVARAVADRHGRAFVVESVRAISGLPHGNALLAGLSSPQTGVTRLSTIVKREDLTADASLAGMAPVPLPDTIRLPTPAAVGALAVPALVLVILGRSRRHRSRRVDSVS